MANGVFFDNPPMLQGNERTQLDQLYAYLSTMSGKLNDALMSLSIEEIRAEAAESARTAAAQGSAETAQRKEEFNTLRSMIIKTANVVRHEMDEMSVTLRDDLAAKSDLGELESRMETEFEATAKGIMQTYRFDERVTGLEQDGAATNAFIRKSTNYIFSGLLDESTQTYGIAIGNGVTDENGELNNSERWATFTKDEIAFWQGDVKLGYYSGNTFYITNGRVTKQLRIGNFVWKKMTDNSLALVLGS